MAPCICVYLHGFLSSSNSQKGQWFKRHLPQLIKQWSGHENCQVLTPEYPMQTPEKSAQFLQDYLQQAGLLNSEQNWFVVGSSMGGFYAQYFGVKYHKPYVMINPALDPVSLFEQYQGEHLNPHTGEQIVIDADYRQALAQFYAKPDPQTPSLLLLDREDEVIPYQHANQLYQSGQAVHHIKLFAGGDHAFQHLQQATPELKKFVMDYLLNPKKH